MEFTTKLWLTAMLANEIEETSQNIKNYNMWLRGCNNLDEIPLYEEQIGNLESYRITLQNLLQQVEEDKLDA